MKVNRSWSKPCDVPNLIAIKKIDWSMFDYGSQIPVDFHEDFDTVNGFHLKRGEKLIIYLTCEGNYFKAQLKNIDRKNYSSESYVLDYGKNSHFLLLIKEAFRHSYEVIHAKRLHQTKNTPIVLVDEEAEYLEFYSTEDPFIYEIKFKAIKSC